MMARPPNRKRQHADELTQDPRPSKKIKSKGCHHSSNFSPEFWDSLSKVWLTPRALRELDRRNSIRPSTKPITAEEVYSNDLGRFAGHGGPDLRHLRGCPEPKPSTMASNYSSRSSRARRNIQTTDTTNVSPKIKRSSAYDANFEHHLIDHNVFMEGYEHPPDRGLLKPDNLDQIHQRLLVHRGSLSPSRVPDSVFCDFQQKNRTASEGTVMRNVIPIIAGNSNIPNEGQLPFTNMESLTNETTVKPVPDYFDGVRIGDIHPQVRQDLSRKIIPTKHAYVPVATNFYLEAKGPRGRTDVAQRQACYDGAHGVRAMHSLQNYGNDEQVYDENAYTFSSKYHDGTLKLYAHHLTAPATPGGRPEYHMTQLKAFALTSDRETFISGTTAFRNARDMARNYRDDFIEAANAKALQSNNPTDHISPSNPPTEEDEIPASAALNYPNSSTSFTTNSTDQTTSKRPRQSHSPPSSPADSYLAKSRTHPGTRRRNANATIFKKGHLFFFFFSFFFLFARLICELSEVRRNVQNNRIFGCSVLDSSVGEKVW
ncbi:hypothetical protein F4778DRAFT_766050 [Xylariomycetidae sp. FL2044]|nr:hypothetical protein F4778DRAFT_766050 [Xylariomycetidae sp. FL2044]